MQPKGRPPHLTAQKPHDVPRELVPTLNDAVAEVNDRVSELQVGSDTSLGDRVDRIVVRPKVVPGPLRQEMLQLRQVGSRKYEEHLRNQSGTRRVMLISATYKAHLFFHPFS